MAYKLSLSSFMTIFLFFSVQAADPSQNGQMSPSGRNGRGEEQQGGGQAQSQGPNGLYFNERTLALFLAQEGIRQQLNDFIHRELDIDYINREAGASLGHMCSGTLNRAIRALADGADRQKKLDELRESVQKLNASVDKLKADAAAKERKLDLIIQLLEDARIKGLGHGSRFSEECVELREGGIRCDEMLEVHAQLLSDGVGEVGLVRTNVAALQERIKTLEKTQQENGDTIEVLQQKYAESQGLLLRMESEVASIKSSLEGPLKNVPIQDPSVC